MKRIVEIAASGLLAGIAAGPSGTPPYTLFGSPQQIESPTQVVRHAFYTAFSSAPEPVVSSGTEALTLVCVAGPTHSAQGVTLLETWTHPDGAFIERKLDLSLHPVAPLPHALPALPSGHCREIDGGLAFPHFDNPHAGMWTAELTLAGQPSTPSMHLVSFSRPTR